MVCILPVFETEEVSFTCRMFMVSCSIFTIRKQNICFPPQFSGVYLQASALTALLRLHLNSVNTQRESGRYQSGDTSVSWGPPAKCTRGNKFICTHADAGKKKQHTNRKTGTHKRTQIDRYPALPSVICRRLWGVGVDCRLCHSWVGEKKAKNEQHSRCLACFWGGSYSKPLETTTTFAPAVQ